MFVTHSSISAFHTQGEYKQTTLLRVCQGSFDSPFVRISISTSASEKNKVWFIEGTYTTPTAASSSPSTMAASVTNSEAREFCRRHPQPPWRRTEDRGMGDLSDDSNQVWLARFSSISKDDPTEEWNFHEKWQSARNFANHKVCCMSAASKFKSSKQLTGSISKTDTASVEQKKDVPFEQWFFQSAWLGTNPEPNNLTNSNL